MNPHEAEAAHGPAHSGYSILPISGRLRARSSNNDVLRAAALLAPAKVKIQLFTGLATWPCFNPDLDTEGAVLPRAVQDFRVVLVRALAKANVAILAITIARVQSRLPAPAIAAATPRARSAFWAGSRIRRSTA